MATFSTPFWAVVTGIVAMAAGVSYLAQPQGDASVSPHTLEATSSHTSSRLADVVVPDDDTPTPPLANALPPCSPFTIDSLGRLVVSAKTLPVLDSWLAVLQGQPLAALEARLKRELPPLAADRAWTLLRSHASYREAEREMLRELKAQGAVLPARELLDRTMALRRRHFDTVSVQELFGVQEARGLYASEVARILADKSLSEAQQAQRVMALRLSLPPEVAQQEFGGTEFSLAMERIAAQMRDEGESDDEVVFRRKQFVDTEGAKSIVEQEREQHETRRQAWELRHPGFLRARDALLAQHEFDSAERQALLDELLQRHFRPDEMADARQFGLR